jgi:LacI family kdg operon repressor
MAMPFNTPDESVQGFYRSGQSLVRAFTAGEPAASAASRLSPAQARGHHRQQQMARWMGMLESAGDKGQEPRVATERGDRPRPDRHADLMSTARSPIDCLADVPDPARLPPMRVRRPRPARMRYHSGSAETGFSRIAIRYAMPARNPTAATSSPDPSPEDARSTGRATIADVARAAGVSKATVSRFLNHRDRLLTRDIASRVERAVEQLAYTPSPMAQALKRGTSRLIGLVVADVTNPFSVAVLRGAEKACKEAGYLVMLFNLGNEGERERDAIAALSSYQVDGFILNTLGRDAAAAAEAARHGKPAVLIDRRHPGMQSDFVSLDNIGAVRLGAAHLQEAGYRELLYVSEPIEGVSSRTERGAAFRAFVAEHAPELRGQTFESSGATPDAIQAAMQTALRDLKRRAGRRPMAVLASNAVISLRVATAAAALGWQFGTDLGLVGFDDTDWAPLIGPGLSCIAQPTDDLGRLAARCLLERLQGVVLPPRQILLPGQLVARGSSRRG